MFEDIDWYNGLLIKPQHMQIIKTINYYKVFYIQKILDPNLYGVIKSNINVSKIHEGIVVIEELKALNIDGSIIDYNINIDSYKLLINLNEEKMDNYIEQIYLYIATVNYDIKSAVNKERYYKAKFGPIIDDAQSDYDEYINVLKPKPFLLLPKDILPKHSYFPILLLKRNKGIWAIQEFIPPHLILDIQHPIIKEVRNILIYLQQKLDELLLKIMHYKQYHTIDYKTMIDMHNYELISPVLIQLQQLLAIDTIKPYKLFCVLSYLLRVLSFSLNKHYTLEIKYEHHQMSHCLNIIISKLNEIMLHVLKQDLIFINFVQEGDDKITITFSDDYIPINNYLYLFCSSTKFSKNELYVIIDQLVIYSQRFETSIKNMRIRGINREIIKHMSNIKDLIGVPVIENAVCFRISVKDEYFSIHNKLIIVCDKTKISTLQFNVVMKQKEIK